VVAKSGVRSTTSGRVSATSIIQKKISLPRMCSLENPKAASIVKTYTMMIVDTAMMALLRKKVGTAPTANTAR
jgi:hypothetical protein